MKQILLENQKCELNDLNEINDMESKELIS